MPIIDDDLAADFLADMQTAIADKIVDASPFETEFVNRGRIWASLGREFTDKQMNIIQRLMATYAARIEIMKAAKVDDDFHCNEPF